MRIWRRNILDYSGDILYGKYRRYEQIYIKLTWANLAMASVLYYMYSLFSIQPNILAPIYRFRLVSSVIIIALCFLGNYVKKYMFDAGILENKTVYLIEKILSVIAISIFIVFADVGKWMFITILMPILVTTLTRGTKTGMFLLLLSFVSECSAFLFKNLPVMNASNSISILLQMTFFVVCSLLFVLFVVFFGRIHNDNIQQDIDNSMLLDELHEKYKQVEEAQEEIKLQYEELKSTNLKLEKTNKRLSDSIGEFYTLQQISQAIGSILDIKELLRYLNDIILGVMGVSYSTIILYDEKTNRLKVHTTNIGNPADMATVKDNINSGILLNVLNRGENIIENCVDPMQYIFTLGRDIRSMICLPLYTKTRKFGLVLVEHTYSNAFDDDNLRLLSIIAQQVGIVMENAELYNRMTELARKDGLTGVYNRQYFQERLEVEFDNAKKGNYTLSLAIFDIDHFKKFNDTFGHLFGDKVLISIVEAVSSELRKNDIIARFGGEEFIILFPRTTLQEAYDKADALRDRISRCIIKDNLITTSVTVSFGVSSYEECALTEVELIKTADDALYEAKSSGRNCVRTANPRVNPVNF